VEAFLLQNGTVLGGKWKIGGLLGHGGMATVYSASHIRNGGSVAVKVLRPILSSDESLRGRFLQEGYTANQVGHPGTVRVLDDDHTPDGWAFLVMERLEGETVDQICERNGNVMPLPEIAFVTEAVLDVMTAAHGKGIVHRDLKPENWFITTDGHLKVLDFGIARMRQSEENARITATGVPMGTPAFMPPEQALAHWDEVDAQSDVYAMGASVWSLLTGSVVHRGRTPAEVLVMVATRRAPPIRSIAPHVPEALAQVIDRSLIFERQARFRDASEMRRAFADAMRSIGVRPVCPRAIQSASTDHAPRVFGETAAPVATIGASSPRSSHLWRWIGIGTAAALVLGGATVFFATRGLNDTSHVPATTPEPSSSSAEPVSTVTALPAEPATALDDLPAASASALTSASAEPPIGAKSPLVKPANIKPNTGKPTSGKPTSGKPKPAETAKPNSGGTLDRYN
jgi:eukaryotic-like serine/threonine-protein kinase